LKLKFFVIAISHNPENTTPSVFIHLKNYTEKISPKEPPLFDSKDDMKKAVLNMIKDANKEHQTSFMITLDEYQKWGVRVGDIIDSEMSIANNGEITN